MTLRIVFAGTSDFAVPSLQVLVRDELDIISVYTRPDRPAGRGLKLTQSPIKDFAKACQLPLRQPENLTDDLFGLKRLAPDLIIVVAYGVILPLEVLNFPSAGYINVHGSLLPRWRGAAPIQRAIEMGDERSGITLIQMDSGLDTGGILFQTETPIYPDDTSGTLHDRLAKIGADTLSINLPSIANARATSTPQVERDATYASKVSPSERWIDWTRSSIELERQIRAFNPQPLARTMLDDQVILLWKASLGPTNQQTKPGTVIKACDDLIRVQTGDGSLELHMVQLPGGRPLNSRNFLNGHPLLPGRRFQLPNYANH